MSFRLRFDVCRRFSTQNDTAVFDDRSFTTTAHMKLFGKKTPAPKESLAQLRNSVAMLEKREGPLSIVVLSFSSLSLVCRRLRS
jgi:hypothetical protein